MKFLVKPFVLYHTPSHCYCYTQHASAKIIHPNLVKWLEWILQQGIHELDEIEIKQACELFNLVYEAVIHFLGEHLRILVKQDENRFQYLYILTDNQVIQTAMTEEFSKHYGLCVYNKIDFSPIKTEKSLILLFNQQYNEWQFKNLYSLSDVADTYFISSFLADKYLIIDNIYNKKKGVPCHFCGINQLRTTTQTSPDIQDFSWLMFYRQLLKDSSPLIPAIPFTRLNEALVIHSLGRFIKQFVDPHSRYLFHDQVNEFWHIDLERNHLEREASMHWLLCDCVNA